MELNTLMRLKGGDIEPLIDTLSDVEMIAYNVAGDVTIEAPAGYSVVLLTLSAWVQDQINVKIYLDDMLVVNGNLVASSDYSQASNVTAYTVNAPSNDKLLSPILCTPPLIAKKIRIVRPAAADGAFYAYAFVKGTTYKKITSIVPNRSVARGNSGNLINISAPAGHSLLIYCLTPYVDHSQTCVEYNVNLDIDGKRLITDGELASTDSRHTAGMENFTIGGHLGSNRGRNIRTLKCKSLVLSKSRSTSYEIRYSYMIIKD